MTVCIIRKNGKVLLGLKKKGFAQGLWNGFGGKVQPEESIASAAAREVKEEAGIEVHNLREFGAIDFHQPNGEVFEVHFFLSEDFTGEPKELEKMIPRWFDENSIPYERMFADDKIWLPLMLAGKKFGGTVWFDSDYKIVKHTIKEI